MVLIFVPKFVGQPEMKHNINLLLTITIRKGLGQEGYLLMKGSRPPDTESMSKIELEIQFPCRKM